MAAATTPRAPHAGMRRKRRRDVTSQDTTTQPIDNGDLTLNKRKVQRVYIHVYSAIHSISNLYPRAVQRSVLTQQYFRENETNATCSSFNVEAYLKIFHQMADGAVRASFQDPSSMADQFMKAVLHQRLLEISKQSPHLQNTERRLEHPKSIITIVTVLRRLFRAFRQLTTKKRCVDTKTFEASSSDEPLNMRPHACHARAHARTPRTRTRMRARARAHVRARARHTHASAPHAHHYTHMRKHPRPCTSINASAPHARAAHARAARARAQRPPSSPPAPPGVGPARGRGPRRPRGDVTRSPALPERGAPRPPGG
jgi:hypothetical protein